MRQDQGKVSNNQQIIPGSKRETPVNNPAKAGERCVMHESKEKLDAFVQKLMEEKRSDYLISVGELKSVEISERRPHLEWDTVCHQGGTTLLTDIARSQLTDNIGAIGANAFWKKHSVESGQQFNETMGSSSAYERFVNTQLQFFKENSPDKNFKIRTLKSKANANESGLTILPEVGTESMPRVIRAVVSPSYMSIDDVDILPEIRDVFSTVPDWDFLSANRTEGRTYLKFVQKTPFINLDGRNIHLGIMISNSETGKGTYKICVFLCDGYCTNGYVFGKRELSECKWWHKRSPRTAYGLLNPDAIDIASLSNIRDRVRESCINAFSENAEEKETLRGILVSSTQRSLPPNKIVTVFSSLKLLSKKQRKAAIENIDDGPLAFTQYGVASAITSLAKKYSYDERIRLEEMGANIILWDASQWERALLAA